MQFADSYEMPEISAPAGQFLSAEDVNAMIRLMQELRDVTLSRGTFTAASDFLARLGDAAAAPSLVRHDALEY